MQIRRLLIGLSLLLPADYAAAAVTSTTQWDVRATGSDLNGGSFDAAVSSPGTDFSQQDQPQVNFDGSAITASATSGSATITITGYTVAAADRGNVLNIRGGSNFVTGWYTITAISTVSNTWTLNATVSAGTATGMTGAMGGSLATPQQAFASMANNNTVWIKAGTYGTTTGFVQPHPYALVSGYSAGHGDGGRATLRITSGSGLTLLTVSQAGAGGPFGFSSLILDCNGTGGSTGVYYGVTGGAQVALDKVKIMGCASYGVRLTANSVINLSQVEVTGDTGGTAVSSSSGGIRVVHSYIHDNVGAGINIDGEVVDSIVANNSGSTADGISIQYSGVLLRNTIHHNGRDGIRLQSSGFSNYIRGNILTQNGGYGISQPGSPLANLTTPLVDGNAFYANGSGTTGGLLGAGGYTNHSDIMLSGDPYLNAGLGNFGLNTGPGALLRSTFPASFPGGLTANATDYGASQTAATGGGGGGARAYTFVQ